MIQMRRYKGAIAKYRKEISLKGFGVRFLFSFKKYRNLFGKNLINNSFNDNTYSLRIKIHIGNF